MLTAMMTVYCSFDTNDFSFLLQEVPSVQQRIVDYFSSNSHQVLVSGVNVLEAIRATETQKRTALLHLMARFPNDRRKTAEGF